MCVLASAVDIVILTHREAVISEQLVTASLRFYTALNNIGRVNNAARLSLHK